MGYKILFLIGSALGHANSTSAIVKELVDQGNEVTYYTTASFYDYVKNSTGADVMVWRTYIAHSIRLLNLKYLCIKSIGEGYQNVTLKYI